ncbi:hypothetical protein, partial [Niallia circulans]|uniref:hypothetical protein n=1 Tax=Niallia circulans TaxID=1397 RepID=UPI001CFFA174
KAETPVYRRTNWKSFDRDKGNTVNESELMLTYRREEIGSLLGDRRWSWTIDYLFLSFTS